MVHGIKLMLGMLNKNGVLPLDPTLLADMNASLAAVDAGLSAADAAAARAVARLAAGPPPTP